jgi:hypothetical protein
MHDNLKTHPPLNIIDGYYPIFLITYSTPNFFNIDIDNLCDPPTKKNFEKISYTN